MLYQHTAGVQYSLYSYRYFIATGDHAGDRSFCVKGKVVDDEDKLSLRLRIGHTGLGGEHPCRHLHCLC